MSCSAHSMDWTWRSSSWSQWPDLSAPITGLWRKLYSFRDPSTPVSVQRCLLKGEAGTVWGWVEETWVISEDVQGIQIYFHQLLDTLADTDLWTRVWVDKKDRPWRWCCKIHTEILEQSHHHCGQVHQHCPHWSELSDNWGHSPVTVGETKCDNPHPECVRKLRERQLYWMRK